MSAMSRKKQGEGRIKNKGKRAPLLPGLIEDVNSVVRNCPKIDGLRAWVRQEA